MSDIPLIDLSQQFENSDAEVSIAEQIDLACRRSGFFAVRGHGIPETIIERCWQVSSQFFGLSEEEKLKVKMPFQGTLTVLQQWKVKLFHAHAESRHLRI